MTLRGILKDIERHLVSVKIQGFPNLYGTDNLPFSLMYGGLFSELLIEKIRAKVENRRLIFAISSGRAGSGFLAKLLGSSPDVRAEHEPIPRMCGTYLKMAMRADLSTSYEKRKAKLIALNARLLLLPETIVYAETNHMFIKTFFDVTLDYYRNVDVVVLRRPMSKVLKSFVELGYFSERNSHWPLWMHDPNSHNCVAEPLGPMAEMDLYDRCIAYLLDIEARACKFRSSYKGVRAHEAHLDDITKVDGARELFSNLRIRWSGQSERVCRQVINARDIYKGIAGNPVSLDLCKERIRTYVEKARQSGKFIPEIVCL
jgi:hypothetical protein